VRHRQQTKALERLAQAADSSQYVALRPERLVRSLTPVSADYEPTRTIGGLESHQSVKEGAVRRCPLILRPSCSFMARGPTPPAPAGHRGPSHSAGGATIHGRAGKRADRGGGGVARVHGVAAGGRDAADPERRRGDEPQQSMRVCDTGMRPWVDLGDGRRAYSKRTVPLV
jgi:hypothetical protein